MTDRPEPITITDEMVRRAARAIDPSLDGNLRRELERARLYRTMMPATNENAYIVNQSEANAHHWEQDAHRRARKVLEAALSPTKTSQC